MTISIYWHDDLICKCASCKSDLIGAYELSLGYGHLLCIECVEALLDECKAALSDPWNTEERGER